jgi:hypothetical protein
MVNQNVFLAISFQLLKAGYKEGKKLKGSNAPLFEEAQTPILPPLSHGKHGGGQAGRWPKRGRISGESPHRFLHHHRGRLLVP